MYVRKLLIILFLFTSSHLYAGATEWQDIEIENGFLLLDIEIAGVPAKAMLDTGAESIAVNEDFLEKNNISYKQAERVTIQGVYGERKTRMIKNLKLKILGTEIPVKRALPYSGGDDVAVIIGLPFFKSFIFQIDYPKKRMKLITRDSLNLNKLKNVKMKHGNNKQSLVVTAYLEEGKSVNLLFDTGSNSGLLFSNKYAERQGWLEKYVKTEGVSSGINETRDTHLLELPYFKIGPYDLSNVMTIVPKKGQETHISQRQQVAETGSKFKKGASYEGILGYDILKFFVVTLDAKTASMHIIAPTLPRLGSRVRISFPAPNM